MSGDGRKIIAVRVEMNMAIKNCAEKFVEEHLAKVLMQNPSICQCPMCHDDMMALALNQLKPHYVATDNGDMYTRLQLYSRDNDMDILLAVAKAVEQVSAHPRHPQQT